MTSLRFFRLAAPRRLAVAGVLSVSLLGLGGCATAPNANPADPLEPFNRHVQRFNDGADALVLKPVATGYQRIVPAPVRTGISNFFFNLSDAWSFVNNLLQLKLQNAGESLTRFNVNTFFGLAGVLDIASEMGIERHREDFGQTLGRWGVSAGPYLVLPLLGPSTVRDALALPVDNRIDPSHQIPRANQRNSLSVLRIVDARANLLRVSSMLDEVALDKYSFTRDAYLQKRQAEIFDGNGPEPPDSPSPSADAPSAPASAPAGAGQPPAPAAR